MTFAGSAALGEVASSVGVGAVTGADAGGGAGGAAGAGDA